MSGTDVNHFYDVSATIIGRGAFGTVVEGTRKESNEKVAIKIIILGSIMLANINLIHTEVKTLQCLNHPNIVKLFDFYETPSAFHICMEIVKGGELFDRITQKKFYSERDARDLVVILVKTAKHCHDHCIVHRDIKAENLLMVSDDDDADVKLVDFGFATQTEGFDLDGVVGSPDYMAPEIWSNKVKYGAPVDMWSIGVLSYIILVGYPPFYDTAPLRLKTKIIRGIYEFHPAYWVNVSDEAKDFVKSLLTVDMHARMTADQALQHPWIALHGDELTPRCLEESINQLKKFNARRRLRASCNAVLAVTRLKSLSKMSVGSSSLATEARGIVNDAQDGITLDTKATRHGSGNIPVSFPVDKSFDAASLASVDSSDIPQFGSKELPEFEDDEDLNKAVHLKISELEEQNKALNALLSSRKDVRQTSRPIISIAENARAKASTASSSDDEAAPPRFADTQAVTTRLTLEKNLATIKSLQLNLLE